ncbi:MAG: dihydrofolate reductase family protein [Agriterribacter sp.]
MRKIILAINITPDGFCDHRWGVADEALHNFYNELLKETDTMLYGRNTFEMMDPYWPSVAQNKTGTDAEIEFAELFTAMHKIVFSRSGFQTNSNNTVVEGELDAEKIEELKKQPGKNILVGGTQIIDRMMQLGLIDACIYVVHPMIGGQGKRFFESIQLSAPLPLKLTGVSTLTSGAVVLRYDVEK